jgi:hypothetical protein
MRKNYISALVATVVLAAPLCACMQQSAQPAGAGAHPVYPARPQPTAPRTVPAQPQYAHPHQFYGGAGPHHGDWLRHSMRLPPQERQRRLEQDPHFRQLTPQRQQELLHRLQAFDAMSPEDQQRVLNRMEMMDHLPPQQQQRAEALFGEFRALDPQRKDMMRRTLRQMRTMPPDARLRFLGSPQIRSRYSQDEVRMLYDFNSIGFVGPER